MGNIISMEGRTPKERPVQPPLPEDHSADVIDIPTEAMRVQRLIENLPVPDINAEKYVDDLEKWVHEVRVACSDSTNPELRRVTYQKIREVYESLSREDRLRLLDSMYAHVGFFGAGEHTLPESKLVKLLAS